MVLTPRGRDLVFRCEPLLQQVHGVLLSVSDENSATGLIRLGVDEIVTTTYLPGFMADMTRELPNIRWEVEVGLTATLRQKLAEGLIDMAFITGPVGGHDLVTQSIGQTELTWVAATSFLCGRDFETLLRTGPVWTLPKMSGQYHLIADILRKHHLPVSLTNTCNHLQAMISLIRTGSGASMVPGQMVKCDLAAGTLTVLDLDETGLVLDFLAIRRHDETDPIVLRVFELAAPAAPASCAPASVIPPIRSVPIGQVLAPF